MVELTTESEQSASLIVDSLRSLPPAKLPNNSGVRPSEAIGLDSSIELLNKSELSTSSIASSSVNKVGIVGSC